MKKHKIYIAYVFGIVFAIVFLGIVQVADAGNKQAERQAKINRLLEILSTKRPSIPVPKEIYTEKDISKRKQYFEERNRKFQEIEEKYEQARNELASMGDEVIDRLLEIYRSGKLDTQVVLVLKKIGTQNAQMALLNIALGQNGFGRPDTLAARNYIELTENKEEIKKLLVSSDEDVLSIALRNLTGVTIDNELLKRLDELLQSTQYHPVLNFVLRTKAAAVIAADSRSELMQEKVSAVVKSLDTVEQMPKSNERFQYDRIGTFADRTYLLLAISLEKMKGADAYLSEATNRLTNNPQRWMLAVRAKMGDSSVKSEIRNFLEDPNMLERTLLRSYAIQGYEKIGTADDIIFLSGIAESDPVVMLDKGGPLLETVNGKPINNAGKRAVIYDEYTIPEWNQLAARQQIPIIRIRARQAIQAIEKKQSGKTRKTRDSQGQLPIYIWRYYAKTLNLSNIYPLSR